MKVMDDLADILFVVIMTRGTQNEVLKKLYDTLNKLEEALKQSKTSYFLSYPHYTMPDLYGFPHISRLFYLKGSALDSLS
jgi:hypothetical protein